jgi:hypothetical protein
MGLNIAAFVFAYLLGTVASAKIVGDPVPPPYSDSQFIGFRFESK